MGEPRKEYKVDESKPKLTLTTGNLRTAARMSRELYWYVINSDATVEMQIKTRNPRSYIDHNNSLKSRIGCSIAKAVLAYLQSILIQETNQPNRPQKPGDISKYENWHISQCKEEVMS